MSTSGTAEYPVIWLPTAACTGCLVSVVNSVSPTARQLLVDEVVPGKHVSMRFNPTIMAGSGDAVIEVLAGAPESLKGQYILVVDGAPVPMDDRARSLAEGALAVVSVGTCSSFGGIPSGTPNPTEAIGVKDFLESDGVAAPVVNVPGCPPHPDWFVGIVASVLLFGLPKAHEVDELSRPKAFYGGLIHDNCPRRADFDVGKFAENPGDPGCLLKLGCKGYVTYADCPTRMWNDGTNWCVGCGGGCIGCVEPEFPDLLAPMYEPLGEGTVPALRVDSDTGRLTARVWGE